MNLHMQVFRLYNKIGPININYDNYFLIRLLFLLNPLCDEAKRLYTFNKKQNDMKCLSFAQFSKKLCLVILRIIKIFTD